MHTRIAFLWILNWTKSYDFLITIIWLMLLLSFNSSPLFFDGMEADWLHYFIPQTMEKESFWAVRFTNDVHTDSNEHIKMFKIWSFHLIFKNRQTANDICTVSENWYAAFPSDPKQLNLYLSIASSNNLNDIHFTHNGFTVSNSMYHRVSALKFVYANWTRKRNCNRF